MSKPYKPKGREYRFKIIKNSNVEYYIGTEKGIKAYKPDKILFKQALKNERIGLQAILLRQRYQTTNYNHRKMNHYSIQINELKTLFKVTYQGGRFKRLELIKGKLTPTSFLDALKVVPFREAHFPQYETQYLSVVYEKQVKKLTTYQSFVDLWYKFYQNYKGITPKFTGADGKAVKDIIKYLTEVFGSEAEAIRNWEILLNNWRNLDSFHQKNTDLKYINSRLNVIIDELKNKAGQNSPIQAADDIVSKFRRKG